MESVGLWNDSLEPCVFGGVIHDENGAFLGHTLAIVYVDDILLASSTEAAEEHVAKALGAVVPTKTTGLITREEGGSLSFIGRVITRERNGSEIFLGVDPQYLNTTFEEYGITKGSENVPDIASHLEKTMTDSAFQKSLSDEAYSRFRRALGRLLWLSQVRHDLKAWLSLLGTQQQQPKHGTEQALKAILRFLFTDMRCCLCLPSRDTTLQSKVCEEQMQTVHLHSFSDASHGTYRFNGRKGLSGGAIFFEGGLVRSLSRQQQALSLSLCEAELYGLQSGSQESIAFSRVVHRLMFALGELDEEEPVTIFIESDSSAAILLLRSLDVPNRSRHVEIRLLWLREQLNSGRLKLKHRPGAENWSDIFTKCLSGKTFFKHRFSLGIIKPDGLLHDLLEVQGLCLVQQGSQRTGAVAFVELCCGEFSSLRQACEFSQIPYVGVIANIQASGAFSRVKLLIQDWKTKRTPSLWIHVHASTPCSSGSPLKGFHSNVVSQADQEWSEVIGVVADYLVLGDSASFELPLRNEIWSRPETVETLEACNLVHRAQVKLCKTGVSTGAGVPIGKTLLFVSNSEAFSSTLDRRFSECTCASHANPTEITYSSTAFYTRKLAL